MTLRTIRFEPTPFLGREAIHKECFRQLETFLCSVPNVLTDGTEGDFGIQVPDLSLDRDRRKFAAWNSQNSKPYINLQPKTSKAVVSAIELHVLNSPRNGISVPNFEIFGMDFDFPRGPSSTDSLIQFNILGNDRLSLNDHVVRTITLRIREPIPHNVYSLKWNFNGVYNVSWFLLKEVMLRNDTFPLPNHRVISFITPMARTTTINSTSGHFISGPLRLICTVQNEGQFKWTWAHDHRIISESELGQNIFSADASRTSILVTSFTVNDVNSTYRCEVERNSSYSRTFIFSQGRCVLTFLL